MKNNKKEKAIEDFLSVEDNKIENTKKEKIMVERSGLIERIDRTVVTNDGRILLREQY
jgi:hypothetical protein